MQEVWCQERPDELIQCPRWIPGIGWRDNWHAWIEWIEFYKNSSKWKNIPFWMTWMTIYSCWKRWFLCKVLVRNEFLNSQTWKELDRYRFLFPESVWSLSEFYWLNSNTTLMCRIWNLKRSLSCTNMDCWGEWGHPIRTLSTVPITKLQCISFHKLATSTVTPCIDICGRQGFWS